MESEKKELLKSGCGPLIGFIVFFVIICNMHNMVGNGNAAIGIAVFLLIIFLVGRLIS